MNTPELAEDRADGFVTVLRTVVDKYGHKWAICKVIDLKYGSATENQFSAYPEVDSRIYQHGLIAVYGGTVRQVIQEARMGGYPE